MNKVLAGKLTGIIQSKIQFVAENIDLIIPTSKVYVTSISCMPELSQDYVYIECFNKGIGFQHPDIIVEVHEESEEGFDKSEFSQLFWQRCDMMEGKTYYYNVIT